MRAGEIVLFDRAYVDFAHLFGLLIRGVFWATRTKENLQFRVVKRRIRRPDGPILADDEFVLLNPNSRGEYLSRLPRRTPSTTITTAPENTTGVYRLMGRIFHSTLMR